MFELFVVIASLERTADRTEAARRLHEHYIFLEFAQHSDHVASEEREADPNLLGAVLLQIKVA